MSEKPVYFCIICGREFRPADPDIAICPSCSGPPEAPTTEQPQGTILIDAPQVTIPTDDAKARLQETVGVAAAGERRFCIVCGREFHPTVSDAVKCHACGGPAEVSTQEQPHSTVLMDESAPAIYKSGRRTERLEPTVGMAGAEPCYCIVCGNKFRPSTTSDSCCPACQGISGDIQPSLVISEADSREQEHILSGTADWQEGQTILDDFVIERVLGQGGMGKVYLLYDRHSQRRFAVKRALHLSAEGRRLFLKELQVWIDLPEHENLVPCRFFRSMGNEVLIFADYVEGGSLQDWIASRRLYAGTQQEALARMLDIAIQFAWGLACLHRLGLVHQDVKPGNVLLQVSEGAGRSSLRARLSDFGLARALAKAVTRETDHCLSDVGVLTSYGRGTPAYFSPEQERCAWRGAEPIALTAKTDIWSWGVSVLEMFVGEARWVSGSIALYLLEKYLEKGSEDPRVPPMPKPLVALLRECFQEEAAARPSAEKVVERLQEVYRQALQADYPRVLAPLPSVQQPKTEERQSKEGEFWQDGREWLERALRAAGRDPAEVEEILPRKGITRRGDLVAQIATYEEAKRVYEQLIQGGGREWEVDLANLCEQKAMIHRAGGDSSGALQELDQAIAILEHLVQQQGNHQLASNLAEAYLNKSVIVSDLGDLQAAVTLLDKTIAIYEHTVDQEYDCELASKLAVAYINKAVIVDQSGDRRTAVALYDKAITILERLVEEGHSKEAKSLATLYCNQAIAIESFGNLQAAIVLYDKAITIYEQLVQQDSDPGLANALAIAYMNKASAVEKLDDLQLAVVLYDRAIMIFERLVDKEGRQELAHGLAMCYMNKARTLGKLGNLTEAITLHDKATTMYERLIDLKGCRELAHELALAYMNKFETIIQAGDSRSALELIDKATVIWEQMVQEGHTQLVGYLVRAYFRKAKVVRSLGRLQEISQLYDQVAHLASSFIEKAGDARRSGDLQSAAKFYDIALLILERLVIQEGRRNFAVVLAMVYTNKATVVGELGDLRTAMVLCDKAIMLFDQLIHQESYRELVGDWARLRGMRALILIQLGAPAQGIVELREAVQILQAEVARSSREDLQGILNYLTNVLRQVS